MSYLLETERGTFACPFGNIDVLPSLEKIFTRTFSLIFPVLSLGLK